MWMQGARATHMWNFQGQRARWDWIILRRGPPFCMHALFAGIVGEDPFTQATTVMIFNTVLNMSFGLAQIRSSTPGKCPKQKRTPNFLDRL